MNKGFRIESPERRERDQGDDIDEVEKEIPQGHMEVVSLGKMRNDDDGWEQSKD